MRLPSRSVSVAKRPASRRSGFTLVELLVVISIIAVLSSLILPGVMNARRAARRAQCLNNMKNCGIAFVDYYTTQNVFPASGRIDYNTGATQVATIGNLLTQLSTPLTAATANYSTGGTPGPQAQGLRYSWVREMLPRLDRSDLFDLWDTSATTSFGTYLNTGNNGNIGVPGKRAPGGDNGLCSTDLRVLVCPEDITTQQGRGNMSYVVNGGFTPHPEIFPVGATGTMGIALDFADMTAGPLNRQVSENLFRMGLMFVEGATRGRRHSPESVKDGLTTTVMVSENVNSGYAQNVAFNNSTTPLAEVNWGCPHPANTSFFVQTAANTDTTAQVLSAAAQTAPTTAANNYQYERANMRGPVTGGINGDVTGLYEFGSPYPSSFHTGGVHIMMCDGGVRFMSDAIAGNIWARLVTPDGGRVVGPATVAGNPNRMAQVFEDATQQGGANNGNTQIPIEESDIP